MTIYYTNSMAPPETVQLDAEITTDGLSDYDSAKYEQFAGLFNDGFEEFVDKNQSYGDTFIKNGVIAYIEHPDKYDTMAEACIEQVMVRIGDKRSRIDNIIIGNGSDKVGEAVAETAGDAANYYRMIEWLAEYGDEMIPKLVDVGTGSTDRGNTQSLAGVLERRDLSDGEIEEIIDAMYGIGAYENEVAN